MSWPATGLRLVKTLDLARDEDLIHAYEGWHAPGAVWAPVIDHIRAQGVLDMEIWWVADRLVMIMQVTEDYPRPILALPLVEEWEKMMDVFQRRLPSAPAGEKWVPMKQIFALGDQIGGA